MSQESLDRLKRLSRLLYGFSVALISLLVFAGAVLSVMALVDASVLERAYPGAARDPELVPVAARLATLALAWITIGLTVYAVSCLMRMFRLFGEGKVFDPTAAFWMRRAGVSLFILAIYGTVKRTLTILILSLGNPPGERQLAIGLEGTQFLSIFVAGVFVLVAHALVLGAEIERENRSFV